jgi:hypothetical protein
MAEQSVVLNADEEVATAARRQGQWSKSWPCDDGPQGGARRARVPPTASSSSSASPIPYACDLQSPARATGGWRQHSSTSAIRGPSSPAVQTGPMTGIGGECEHSAQLGVQREAECDGEQGARRRQDPVINDGE